MAKITKLVEVGAGTRPWAAPSRPLNRAAPSTKEETCSVWVKLLQASLLMGTCSRFLPSMGEAVKRFPGEPDPVSATPWPLHHLPDSRQAVCRQI